MVDVNLKPLSNEPQDLVYGKIWTWVQINLYETFFINRK